MHKLTRDSPREGANRVPVEVLAHGLQICVALVRGTLTVGAARDRTEQARSRRRRSSRHGSVLGCLQTGRSRRSAIQAWPPWGRLQTRRTAKQGPGGSPGLNIHAHVAGTWRSRACVGLSGGGTRIHIHAWSGGELEPTGEVVGGIRLFSIAARRRERREEERDKPDKPRGRRGKLAVEVRREKSTNASTLPATNVPMAGHSNQRHSGEGPVKPARLGGQSMQGRSRSRTGKAPRRAGTRRGPHTTLSGGS